METTKKTKPTSTITGPGCTSIEAETTKPERTEASAMATETATITAKDRLHNVPMTPGMISSAVTINTPTTLVEMMTVAAIRRMSP